MSISQFEIQNPDGTTIFGDYQKSANQPQKSKFAIILHGFKGNHRWGFLPTLRDLFAANGYNAIAYTHSFSGYIPDSPKYGGCRSWIELPELPSGTTLSPVLDDATHAARSAEIQALL